MLIKTFLFEKGVPIEKILPAGIVFKTFSTEEGFTVEYPDWTVIEKTEKDIVIGKEDEVVMIIAKPDEYSDIKEMEKEFREQFSKEEGVNLINLKLIRDSFLIEGTLIGEKIIEGGLPKSININIDKSKPYHFYGFQKSSNEKGALEILII